MARCTYAAPIATIRLTIEIRLRFLATTARPEISWRDLRPGAPLPKPASLRPQQQSVEKPAEKSNPKKERENPVSPVAFLRYDQSVTKPNRIGGDFAGNGNHKGNCGGETQSYEDNVIDILLENLARQWRGERALVNGVV